jgi:hypothetical protein
MQMVKNKSRYFREQFDAIAHEISVLAIACDIDVFADDVADRILKNDTTVCRRANPNAFEKLRHHLFALYPLEVRAIERLGIAETKEMLEEVRGAFRRLRNQGRPGSAPDQE